MSSRIRTLSREPLRAVAESDVNVEDPDDEKSSAPKAPPASGILTVLAFLAGSAVAYGFLETLSAHKSSSRPSASPAQNYEVLETLNLLTTLDLDRYSELVARQHVTLKQLADQPSGVVIDGFKPYHFRHLVTEARKIMSQGIRAQEDPAQQLKDDAAAEASSEGEASASGDGSAEKDKPPAPETAPPPTGRGRDASAAKPKVGGPPREKASRPESGRKLGGGLPPRPPPASGLKSIHGGAAKGGAGGYSPRPRTLPPQPTFSPPPTVPAVCHAWRRTSALKALLRKHRSFPPAEAAGIGEPNACAGAPEDGGAAAAPITRKHLLEKHPGAAAAKQGSFTDAGLSAAQVRELRIRGVSEQFYVDHELKLLYCVIPKAGCTSYKAWLLNNAGLFKGGTVHNRELYKGPRIVNGQFISDEALRGILNGGEYFKFTVTRSPYTRSLATYLERFNKCENSTRRTKNECVMWKRALTGGEEPLPKDDMTFVEYLKTMKAHKLNIVDFRNAHWVPGVQVCGLDHIEYDWVGRLEDPTDAEMLYAIVGERPMAKKHGVDLAHSVGTSAKIKKYYTEEAKQLVAELYESDISRIGYKSDGVVP